MSLFGSIASIGAGFAMGGPMGALGAFNTEVMKAAQPKTAPGEPPSTGFLNLLGSLGQLGGKFSPFAAPVTKMAPPLTLQLPQGPGMTPPLIPPDSTVTRGGLTINGPFGTGLQAGGTTTTYFPSSSPGGGAVGCPKGYHPNKTGYYRRGQYIAAGSTCVKNRRRNPLNARALSRSISRIQSAKNAAAFLSRVSVRGGGCGCK